MLSAAEFDSHGLERGRIGGTRDRSQGRLFIGDNFADRVLEIDVRS